MRPSPLAGTLYYAYAVASATPWLNPNGATPVLQFEVRFPPVTPMPAARGIAIELQTNLNQMPGEVRAERFRSDGDRPVIAGDIELAFPHPRAAARAEDSRPARSRLPDPRKWPGKP